MLFAALSMAALSLRAHELDLEIGNALSDCDPTNVYLAGAISDDKATQVVMYNGVVNQASPVTPSLFSASASIAANQFSGDFLEYLVGPDAGESRGPVITLSGYIDLDPNQEDIFISGSEPVRDPTAVDDASYWVRFTDAAGNRVYDPTRQGSTWLSHDYGDPYRLYFTAQLIQFAGLKNVRGPMEMEWDVRFSGDYPCLPGSRS